MIQHLPKSLSKRNFFTSSSNETVKNSGETYAFGLLIPPLKHNISSRAVIELDNNTFHSRPSSYLVLFFEGEKNVTIRYFVTASMPIDISGLTIKGVGFFTRLLLELFQF